LRTVTPLYMLLYVDYPVLNIPQLIWLIESIGLTLDYIIVYS
jgi:hypothetical protein